MSITNRGYGETLSRNMLAGGGSALISAGVTFVSYPVYLKYLGYSDYGLWMILSTIVTLSQMGGLGIAPAVSKLIAEESGRMDRVGAQRYAEIAISAIIVLGLLTTGLLLSIRGVALDALQVEPQTAAAVKALLPLVLFLCFYSFLNDVVSAVLVGLGRTDIASMITTAGQFVGFGCSFVLLQFGHGILALGIGAAASLIATHLATAACIRRTAGITMRPALRLDWARTRTLFRLSSVVFASSVAASLFFPVNKFLLSSYVGLSAVPMYEIACTTSMRLRSLFETALRPITPALSHSLSDGSGAQASELDRVDRQVRRVLALAACAFGGMILLTPVILRLWLGRSGTSGIDAPLRIMLGGAFLSLLGVPAYYALLGVGKAGILFWSHVIQSAANIVFLVVGRMFGMPLTLLILVSASAGAMGVSTVFLTLRYAAERRRFAHPAGELAREHMAVTPVLAE